MSYGTFSSSINNHYNRVNYTVSGTTYYNISIFKTNPSTESIAPAIYENDNKQLMSYMNPSGISSSNVIAKTNAGSMQYGQTGFAFYGTFYQNGTLYKNGIQASGPLDSIFDQYPYPLGSQSNPLFCIKTNGAVNIRWPLTKNDLQTMLPYCQSIIAASEPLVYNSTSVFETAVYDAYDGIRIADWGNLSSTLCHYNDEFCNYSGGSQALRTMLGHKPDGSYFMVCADSSDFNSNNAMNLRVAAKLMCDLGCDYAVNLDGGGAVQMRVASGYTNGYTAGKMTTGGTDYYGTAVCAYLL